ncbi:MAG TPA: 4'-phosphopantetheinyl transferase superfamily protein [Candidatus Limnocylindria bacterium]|jgi:4'-phosphopantetheinyl transferase|nr:4'-phosphopantetheinyl transferase superfamily protein [Candidatus Limnocylindria bacterium]
MNPPERRPVSPSLRDAWPDDEVHLWKIQLDWPESVLARFRRDLSVEEQQRADRFVFDKHRRRYVVAHGAMRSVLSRYLGCDPRQVEYQTNSKGKPAIKPGLGDGILQFNLSHSEEVALLAVTQGRAVGVDLEQVREFSGRDGIVEKQFSAAEWEEFQRVPPPLRNEAFTLGWTRKEAFVKALGEGLSCDLRAFSVSLTPGEEPRLVHIDPSLEGRGPWALGHIDPEPGFCGALVVAGSGFVVRERVWSPEV